MSKAARDEFDNAVADHQALGKQMRKEGVKEETPAWVKSNDRVVEASKGVSRWRRG